MLVRVQRILFYLLIPFMFNSFAAVTLSGNKQAPANQTFSFNVDKHVLNDLQNIFYVAAAANQAGLSNEFAVSRVMRERTQFEPIAFEKITFNRQKDSDNPLFNQGISFLTLMQGELASAGFGNRGEHPVVVADNNKNTIYLFETINREAVSIVSATNGTATIHNIPDASGNPTDEIVGIVGANAFLFAATKPFAGGNFGDAGSGIAEIIIGTAETNGVKTARFKVIDAVTGTELNPGDTNPFNRALPFDRTIAQIKIGNDVVSIDDIIDMHWDRALNRVYIALQVVGGAGANDGARGIVVLRVNQEFRDVTSTDECGDEVVNKFELNPLELNAIAPDAALIGVDNIVGATGANAQVSIHKVRSMATSTALRYLIVQGNVGAPAATQNVVFALPLVNGAQDASLNGTIADKNQEPIDVYSQNEIPLFVARLLPEPTTTAAQMTTQTDVAAQVGGGALAAGNISDIYVEDDAVFVTVATAAVNQEPGTFHSQAIFDDSGKIVAWTNWQRVSGTFNRVFGGALDACQGNFYSMIQTNANVNIITRTEWSSLGTELGFEPLSQFVVESLATANGGVQGLFNFSELTPGLNNISLLGFTGLNKIILAESGVLNGSLVPNFGTDFNAKISFTNGTITQTLPIAVNNPKVVSIEGGVLADIGPVIALEIGVANNNGWLFAGGCKGLAVLAQANGDGWDTATGLGPDFAGLQNGMAFKIIGDYTFVKKLIYDDNFLYVLTNERLDRIDLTQGVNNLSVVTVAHVAEFTGASASALFLDVVISGKFALIAANNGIFRVGNGKNIQIVSSSSQANWSRIIIPEGICPPGKLVPISITGRAQDLVKNNNVGNINVLGAYRGQNKGQVNRFFVQLNNATEVDDNSVLPLPDIFVKNINSFFVNFGAFRNQYTTDGALHFHARPRDLARDPAVFLLPQEPHPQSGIRSFGVRSFEIPLDIASNSLVTGILRDSASGSWLISGDFGLRINE